jgi:hypothetical protein
MPSMLRLFPLIFCAFSLFHASGFAQSSAGGGTIQGTVNDNTGAIIPGARIVIRQIETGRVTNLTSNNEGFFTTPSLSIGKYKIRVEVNGWKSWEGDLIVETGRIAEVNAVLEPGQVSETVIIEGNITPLITTTEPTEGATLDSQRIKELPVNGRNINTLLEDVTPGVEAINDVNGGVRISGLMVYSTNYVQDGATSNNREFGGSGIMSGLESIGEVKVETSTSSARYTTPTSVIITTKGGGNTIHGSLYETHRNNSFGVARARQDVLFGGQQYSTPKLIRNEFGGSISGPVYLPRFGEGSPALYDGHNRTFFFFSRESLRLRQGITREFVVPTAAMRAGDFSGLVDNQGRFIQLYDPKTTRIETINGRQISVRDPFPNNQIPIARMSPLAKKLFAITALPTDITNPLVANNLKIPVATNAFPNRDDDPMTARLDHRFSEKDNAFIKVNGGKQFSYFLGTSSGAPNINGAPTANNEANVTYLPMSGISGALSWTHTFSPTFFVETLLNRTWQSTQTVTGPVGAQRNWSQELGLPNNLGEIGWPSINNIGLTAGANNYTYIEGDNRRALYTITTNLEQNYTLIRGTHSIQFGGLFRNERNHLQPDQGAISGSAAFNSLATALHSPTLGSATNPSVVPQTGYDTANLFLGYAARYDVGLKRGFMQVYQKTYGLYLQDNYRVNNRLTVNGGLRWDINPVFHERNGLLSGFDVENHALLLPEPLDYYYKIGVTTPQLVSLYEAVNVKFESADQVGRDKKLFKANLYDFSPRAGFAYRMFDGNKQMVIRGGYGIYTSAIPMRTLLAQFSGLLPFRATFSYNPNAANFSPDGIPNYLLRTDPGVIAGSNSANIVALNNPGAIGVGQGVVGMAENQPSLRIHEWNLAIEKQLNANTVFRFTYTGKHGVNADQLIQINPLPNDYVYFSMTQQLKPTGAPNSGIALRTYDQNAYASVQLIQKSGYINSSTWTAQIERRFTKGLGFQAFYTLTNALRFAGNTFRDDVATVYHPSLFLPGTLPTEEAALNRTLFYDRDTAVPKHRVRWNWNYELPFGKGKWLGGKASGFLGGLIGGWKLSGTGTILNTWYSRPTGQWGEFGNFETYGKKYKIMDCRATPALATNAADERCTPGYLWFNGYISNRVINSKNAAGLRNGVYGLPDNYKPAQAPVIPWPVGGLPTDPNNADYDTNVVYIPLINSAANANCDLSKGPRVSCQRVGVDTGYHPWRNQYQIGPYNWVMDASLLKFFTIKERLRLRVNIDFFNMFNIQGLNTPNAEGIVSLSNSYNPNNQNGFKPRQLQGTLRLEW